MLMSMSSFALLKVKLMRPMLVLLSSLLLSLNSCSNQQLKPTPAEKLILEEALSGLSSDYSSPRLVQGELVVNISNINVLLADSLIASNHRQAIPAGTAPTLKIWSADIAEYNTQKPLGAFPIEPKPADIFVDPEYHNRILYWDFSEQIEQFDSITISRKFKYVTFDYRPLVDRELEQVNWNEIPTEIVEQYTRSEMFLEQDTILLDTVKVLLEGIHNPVTQAEVIYDWVRASMTYVYPPRERGVRCALEDLSGDCGQYSALFITMSRIAGIPARQQSGFNFVPGNTGDHVWSEIYLPVKGWVPVDATRDDGFLHLDNRRLITSIGLNILLNHTPDWATFANSEVEAGRTDFMQMYTLVSSGLTADFSSQKKVLRSVELD